MLRRRSASAPTLFHVTCSVGAASSTGGNPDGSYPLRALYTSMCVCVGYIPACDSPGRVPPTLIPGYKIFPRTTLSIGQLLNSFQTGNRGKSVRFSIQPWKIWKKGVRKVSNWERSGNNYFGKKILKTANAECFRRVKVEKSILSFATSNSFLLILKTLLQNSLKFNFKLSEF